MEKVQGKAKFLGIVNQLPTW